MQRKVSVVEDGKMYLYDIVNIKKEMGTHFQS